MFVSLSKKILPLSLLLISYSAFAENSKSIFADATLTGNIGLVSQYIYRGGVENDDIAMQGGLEYALKSGFAVGYWGSSLDYDSTDATREHGFEHDLYLSYAQELNQDWAYKVQATSYIYHNGGSIYGEADDKRTTTAYDVLGQVVYKDLTLGLSVVLADASFGNAGDVYMSAAYTYALPQDFHLNTSIGVSAYNSSHNDSLIQTKKDFAFSEARVGISKVIPNTGVTASFDYILGGEDRLGEDFDDHFVLGLNYGF